VIEAVLFDGDQTLWDFERVMRLALAAVLAELRVARPGARADALQIDDLQADRNEVAREREGVEFNLARLRRLGFARTLCRLHGVHDESDENGEGGGGGGGGGSGIDDAALALRLTATYFDHRDRDPALFDDTLPCLEALQSDYRLGLLSNGSRLPEVVGLGGFFEAVVFAQDHNVAKPDRGIFAVVETLMGVAPGSLVLVGDHPLNDVVGAKRSGWRAVWIDRRGDGSYPPPPGTDERPDATITSLDQLAGVLAAL
jgi:FMN hydrolase / 5-amino-6-(5-phospho-D-ribitylamino)uracil phosphatase